MRQQILIEKNIIKISKGWSRNKDDWPVSLLLFESRDHTSGEFHMSTITVMKNNIVTKQPVGDGVLKNNHPAITQLKNISKYLTEEYCVSCAYWRQKKGNFGSCGIISEKPRDGTKKDSSCKAYRLNPTLYENLIKFKQKTVKKISVLKLIRESYNITAKRKYKFAKINYHKNNPKIPDMFYSHLSKQNFLFGLPYSLTSDISPKSGYFMKQYNYRIIDFAMQLFQNNNSLTNAQIADKTNKIFGTNIPRITIYKWKKQILKSSQLSNSRRPNKRNNKFMKFWKNVEHSKCSHCNSSHTIQTIHKRKLYDYKRIVCTDCKKTTLSKNIPVQRNHIYPQYMTEKIISLSSEGFSIRKIASILQEKYRRSPGKTTVAKVLSDEKRKT